MRPFLFLALALLSSSPAFGRDEEPVVNGLKKSEWVKMLDDASPRRRRAAVVALGVVGSLHKDVVPALGRALRDKEAMVRAQAIQVLAGMKQEDVRELVPEFADLIREDPDANVRQQAAALLGRIGVLAKPALGRLIQTLADKDIAVRAAAAEAIGRIGSEAREAVPSLLPLLNEKEARLRLAAIFALGRIGFDSDVQLDAMLKLLASDAEVDVRREAARSVGFLEGAAKTAIPALLKSLKQDKSPEVRQQSALALGKMGPDVAAHKDALVVALKGDPDKTVRLYVLRTTTAILGDNRTVLVPDLAALLKAEPEGEIRLAVVQELGAMGEAAKPALPALMAARQDVQIGVREAAAAAIKKVTAEPKKP